LNPGKIHTPIVGDQVVTVDYEPVGVGRSVYATAFVLEAPDGSLTTLAMDCVYTRDEWSVTLICDHSGMARYALDRNPFAAPSK
jgi:hypothetical protein